MKADSGEMRQRAKYQIYSFYQEKLGIITVKEILISLSTKHIQVQTIGMKNILLSNKVIQLSDEGIKNTYSIPHLSDGSIKGCKLILNYDKDSRVSINMFEQDIDNIHKY